MQRPTLTNTQTQVFDLVARGLASTITERLGLSEQQANGELIEIFEKYGLGSRVEIILFAHSQRNPVSPRDAAAA
jgi:DNA-binding NarL/FixJ family response regulator